MKLNITIALVIILSSTSAYSNTTTVDSLLSIYKNSELSDSIRLDALMVCSHESIYSSSMAGLTEVANMFFEYSRDNNSVRAQLMGEILMPVNDYSIDNEIDENLKFLEKAKAQKTISLEIATITYLIEYYESIADKEHTEKLLPRLNRLLQENVHPLYKAMAYMDIASIHRVSNDYLDAYNIALVGLGYAKQSGGKTLIAEYYHALADIFLDVLDYKRSEQYHKKALQIFTRSNHALGIATIVFHQSAELYHQGAFQKSLAYLDKINNEVLREISNAESVFYALKSMNFIQILDFNNYQINLDSAKKWAAKNNSPIEYERIEYAEALAAFKRNDNELALDLFDAYCDKYMPYASHFRLIYINELAYKTSKMMDQKIRSFGYLENLNKLKDSLAIETSKARLAQSEIHNKIISDSLKREEQEKLVLAKEEKAAAFKKRKNRIQYSLVVLVVLLLATVIAVATKFKISPKLASGLIFIFFILTFEFLLVVLDPWVDSISNGEVGWKIGINTAIALVLFGVHQVSEKRLKMTLIKV